MKVFLVYATSLAPGAGATHVERIFADREMAVRFMKEMKIIQPEFGYAMTERNVEGVKR